jgi:Asp-tRNA(Asn)/Glu-tRNA(Gln) amidotransferase A subunit family amidase
MKREPHTLTASEAVEHIAAGQLTSEALVRSCLERIGARDAQVRAWAHLDHDAAIAAARRADAGPRRGILHGIPVGFKDVIDTADQPTAYGSRIYADHQPAADAACVAMSREAGALVLGKTASTEFAYRHPSDCTNPHHPGHSPGGSSSGSAAAVADTMVPLAVGTQTSGSVIRPAAYCGVHAIKPGYGELSFSGVRHLSESLDTLGCMARSLEDLALFLAALQLREYRRVGDGLARSPRLAVYRSELWDDALPDARSRFDEAVQRLARAGAEITEIANPGLDRKLLGACWTVTKFEAGRVLMHDFRHHRGAMSAAAQALVDDARAIGLDAYHAACVELERGRNHLLSQLAPFDGTLTLSAVGEAPVGLHDTGPVLFNYLWTLAWTPALNLPVMQGDTGLPIGLQVIGARHGEQALLATGRWIERQLS